MLSTRTVRNENSNRKTFLFTVSQVFSTNAFRETWAVLFAFSILGISDIPGAVFLGSSSESLCLDWIIFILIAIFKASLLTLGLTVCKYWKPLFILATFFVTLYCVACLVNGISYSLYQFGITHKLVVVLSQTTRAEIVGFMPGLLSNLTSTKYITYSILGILALTFVILLIRRIRTRTYLKVIGVLSITGCILLILELCTLDKGRNALLITTRVPKIIIEVYKENRELERLLNSIQPLQYSDQVTTSYAASTVVLVIGESASRGHMSAYGYKLATTPRIDRMRDSLFIYTNAIGSSVSTAENLERIMTFETDVTPAGDWYRYPLLIDLLNTAGYKTFWLSNQEKQGILSSNSGALSAHADVVEFVGNLNTEDHFTVTYDEQLLPEFEKAMLDSATNKFIGIHLLGSHTRYNERYPSEYSRFKGNDIMRNLPRPWLKPSMARIIAEYDNSIHYTDTILAAIIRKIADSEKPSLVMYLSDHGENVYDEDDFIGRSTKYVEVPLIIYTNKAYRTKNPDIILALRRSLEYPISTATLANPILTLTGTYYPLYDKNDDFLSSDFKKRPRYVNDRIWQYDNR